MNSVGNYFYWTTRHSFQLLPIVSKQSAIVMRPKNSLPNHHEILKKISKIVSCFKILLALSTGHIVKLCVQWKAVYICFWVHKLTFLTVDWPREASWQQNSDSFITGAVWNSVFPIISSFYRRTSNFSSRECSILSIKQFFSSSRQFLLKRDSIGRTSKFKAD